MKKLDYAPAWYKIGEAYGTPFEERTDKQKEIAIKHALCLSFDNYFTIRDMNDPNISDYFEILAKDMNIKFIGLGTHWWPDNGHYDRARSDFAILMWALGNAGFQDLLDYAAGEGKYANT